MHNTTDRLVLELLLRHLELFLIQDHQIFGCLPNNANSLLLAISIDTSIVPRVQPIKQMVLNSILAMAQVQLLDSLDKMSLLLQVLKLKTLSSDK